MKYLTLSLAILLLELAGAELDVDLQTELLPLLASNNSVSLEADGPSAFPSPVITLPFSFTLESQHRCILYKIKDKSFYNMYRPL